MHKCGLTLRHIGHTPTNNRFLNLWKHCYSLTHASFHKVQMYAACRYQHVTSRCITSQDGCVQQSHATKRLSPNYKANLCKFVAMLLLRNKDQL